MFDSPHPYHITSKNALQVHIFIPNSIDKRMYYAYNKYVLKVRIVRQQRKAGE
jgi:hypothetical protein